MSGGIEVKKPIRFFFFFGLFLAFVLLGVRACNERRTQEEVAEVEKILNENRKALIPSKESLDADTPDGQELNLSNSDELQGFESKGSDKEVKKGTKAAKKKPKVKKRKKVVKRDEKTKKSKASNGVKAAKFSKSKAKPKKQVVSSKSKSKKIESQSAQETTSATVTADGGGQPKMKILVKGQGYALDGISVAKLKGAVKLNSNPSGVVVLLFSEDTQGRSLVVKRAELRSALLRAGLSPKVDVEFKTVDRKGYAEILFY